MTDNSLVPIRFALSDVQRFAAAAPYLSKLYQKSEAHVAALMISGYELGLTVSQSIEFIHVVKGKPALSPRGHLALLHASGLLNPPGLLEILHLQTDDGDFVGVYCRMKRADSGFEFSGTFTMNDAKKAGLVKPDSGWAKYPAQMCQWRVIGYVADVVAPDVSGGMKRADEFGGEITIEGDYQVAAAEYRLVTPDVTDSDDRDLIVELGRLAQAVNDAGLEPSVLFDWNEGQMPTTVEEIDALHERLRQAVEES